MDDSTFPGRPVYIINYINGGIPFEGGNCLWEKQTLVKSLEIGDETRGQSQNNPGEELTAGSLSGWVRGRGGMEAGRRLGDPCRWGLGQVQWKSHGKIPQVRDEQRA